MFSLVYLCMAHRSKLDSEQLGFLSYQIDRLSKHIENTEYRRHLSKTAKILREIRLRSKYRWFSSENDMTDSWDKKIPVKAPKHKDEELLSAWCEAWPTCRFLLDMAGVAFNDPEQEKLINLRLGKDVGLYRIAEKHASILDGLNFLNVNEEHVDEILHNFLSDVDDYANNRTIKYNSTLSRIDSKYYSWRKKLASFWFGLSSLATPLLAHDLNNPDKSGGPIDKAIVQREKLLERRQVLDKKLLLRASRYAADYVNARRAWPDVYVGTKELPSLIMPISNDDMLRPEIRSLVSYIDTVIASKEIIYLMRSPIFTIYLRNQLNDMLNKNNAEWAQTMITQDALLSGLASGDNDKYAAYWRAFTQYVNEGRLKIVVNEDAININVYNSSKDISPLYTIQLSVSGIASHGIDLGVPSEIRQHEIADKVVYLSTGHRVLKAPATFDAYTRVGDKSINSVGLMLNYEDLGYKQMPNYGRVIYVFFDVSIIPGK